MTIEQAQRLTQKILAGEASPEEKAALQRYIADQAATTEPEETLLPLQELETMPNGILPAGMEARIFQAIMQDNDATAISRKRSPVLRQLLRISAAAAILVAISLVAYRIVNTYTASQQTIAVLLDTITTPAGSLKEITLADGSRIRLNGATTLRFPRSFSGAAREVYLDGEAFFEIAKDSSRPFVVHAPAFSTTVLGTSFNINSSAAHQQHAAIAVATGKVRVATSGQKGTDSIVMLSPGEKASYHAGDPAGLRKGITEIAAIGAWKDRHFYYAQSPLSEILTDLERSYGLHFSVKDQAALSCTYSATFRNMKAEDILQTLSLMAPVTFSQKESLVEVSGHACH